MAKKTEQKKTTNKMGYRGYDYAFRRTTGSNGFKASVRSVAGHKKKTILLLVVAVLLLAATALLGLLPEVPKAGQIQPKTLAPSESRAYQHITDYHKLVDFNVTGNCATIVAEGLLVKNVPKNVSASGVSQLFVFTEKGLIAERSLNHAEVECKECASPRELWFVAQSLISVDDDCTLEYRIEFSE